MKQLILCMMVCLMTGSLFIPVKAGEVMPTVLSEAGLRYHISDVYARMDFTGAACLPFDVFEKAYRGYLTLFNEGRLNEHKQILTICDFSASSVEKRMWIIDLEHKKVLLNTLVAHGQGSGKEYATSFSNKNNTHKTSLGFYVTGDTYEGEHGTSLHLYGMDKGYNDAAYDRGIVVHGANYVCKKFIDNNDNCLGRSWGCPAVPSQLSDKVINTIKDGTCLFIYYPEKKYLANSVWLNKPVKQLPGARIHLKMPEIREITIKYVSSTGKVDSIITVPQ